MPSQREVELSHDVTFDEDSTLGKVRDLPIPRKDNDDDAGKHDEPITDDPIPDVEGLMDPIDPPPSEPSTSRKYHCDSKILLMMLSYILHRGGHFMKARS